MMTEPNMGEFAGEQEPRTRGPGSRLRSARERKGMDLKLVADQLHLTERNVTALENDAYDELPGLVFVQGYLRNYARLVDEPVDEILADFGQVKPANEYAPALKKFSFHSHIKTDRRRVGSGHGLAKTVIWLLVLALIVLFVVWKRGYLQLPPGLLGQQEQGGAEQFLESRDVAETGSSSGTSPIHTLMLPETVNTPPSVSESETAALQMEVPEPTDRSSIEAPTDAQAVPAEDETRDEPAAEVETPAAEEPSEPEIASVAPLPSETGGTAVVMEFTAPCWVDVRDADGEKVLYGGISGGETHTLSGTPPYRLVLGNSQVVKITVGGRPFDMGPFASGKVARFSIDPREAAVASSGAQD